MLTCPNCGSYDVYLSRTEDRKFYRVLLAAKVRCHGCGTSHFAPYWQAYPAPGSKHPPSNEPLQGPHTELNKQPQRTELPSEV